MNTADPSGPVAEGGPGRQPGEALPGTAISPSPVHAFNLSEPPGLWPSVGKLMRLRVVILLSSFRRARMRRKIMMVFLGLLLLGFLGFIFFLSWVILGFLRSPNLAAVTGDVGPFLESVPVLVVGGAFLGILFTSFGVLLQALYLAGDMDFLLSTPLPIRAVFLTKLLQAILPNFSLICLFALPLLFGLGAAGHYNLLYYPLVIIVLAALALAAAGFSSLLVMGVVRLFPARRVAEILGFLGAILSFVCSQSGQLANLSNVSAGQANQALNLVARFNNPWSPLAWAGRGLVDLGEGRWLPAVFFLLLSLGLAGLVFGLALTTAERLYYTGWASMQGVALRKKPPRAVPARPAARPATLEAVSAQVERRVPAPIRAIILKDYYVLRRDLRNMSQLVTPLIFGIVYAFMFLRNGNEPPMGRGEAPAFFVAAMKNLYIYGNVGIALFVGWMLLGRLAGMGFSQEGKSYWILKSAPVSVNRLLVAKYLVAFIPTLLLSWLFLVAISLIQSALGSLWFTLLVVTVCIAGNTGLNLAFGVTGANMSWEDPRHMQRGTSSCFGAIASMVYLPLCLALFFGPALLGAALEWPEVMGQVIGLVIGSAFSLACAIVPLLLVRSRIPRLGEE